MTEVARLYEDGDENAALENPDFCMTPTAEAIHRVLEFCQDNGEIGLIVGAPGVGKTMALQNYLSANRGCWLATASETRRRLTPAMFMVAESMGRRPVNRGAARCRQVIVYAIHDMESQMRDHRGRLPLLVIDEAGFLDDQPLDELRSIHDQTGVGLVLCGNPDFRARLSGTVNSAAFAQLTSRIGIRHTIDTPSIDDVSVIADHYGIANAQARAFLEKIAERERGLRGVVRLIRAARGLGARLDSVTLDNLRCAQSLLGG